MITGNETAMPCYAHFNKDGKYVSHPSNASFSGNEYGLTIRQYLTAMAMQGLMANEEDAPVSDFESAAKRCVLMADAIIKELNKDEI